MKVLTLIEPWATFIKDGYKKIETRNWKTYYRGELYIHTSLSKIQKKVLENENLCKLFNLDDIKYGYIICKCNLVDCIYMTEEFINEIKNNNYLEYLCGEYKVGRYAWILDNIEVLKCPIETKGHLGIWNYK